MLEIGASYICTCTASSRQARIKPVATASEVHDSSLWVAGQATNRRFGRYIRNLTLSSPRALEAKLT